MREWNWINSLIGIAGTSSNQTCSPTSANGDPPTGLLISSQSTPQPPSSTTVAAATTTSIPTPQLVQIPQHSSQIPLLHSTSIPLSTPIGKQQKKHQTNSRRLMTSVEQQGTVIPPNNAGAEGPETAEVIQILRSISIDETTGVLGTGTSKVGKQHIKTFDQ